MRASWPDYILARHMLRCGSSRFVARLARAAPARAQWEIRVWHAMGGARGAELEKLVAALQRRAAATTASCPPTRAATTSAGRGARHPAQGRARARRTRPGARDRHRGNAGAARPGACRSGRSCRMPAGARRYLPRGRGAVRRRRGPAARAAVQPPRRRCSTTTAMPCAAPSSTRRPPKPGTRCPRRSRALVEAGSAARYTTA